MPTAHPRPRGLLPSTTRLPSVPACAALEKAGKTQVLLVGFDGKPRKANRRSGRKNAWIRSNSRTRWDPIHGRDHPAFPGRRSRPQMLIPTRLPPSPRRRRYQTPTFDKSRQYSGNRRDDATGLVAALWPLLPVLRGRLLRPSPVISAPSRRSQERPGAPPFPAGDAGNHEVPFPESGHCRGVDLTLQPRRDPAGRKWRGRAHT